MRHVSARALVVATVLLLAFAPAASASHTTAFHVESGTLDRGGSVTLSGTIDCTAGYFWTVSVLLSQKVGKAVNNGSDSMVGLCSTTGPESWTGMLFGGPQVPYKPGHAVATSFAQVCKPVPDFHCAQNADIPGEKTKFRIRR
jgi:hypothetical protein